MFCRLKQDYYVSAANFFYSVLHNPQIKRYNVTFPNDNNPSLH